MTIMIPIDGHLGRVEYSLQVENGKDIPLVRSKSKVGWDIASVWYESGVLMVSSESDIPSLLVHYDVNGNARYLNKDDLYALSISIVEESNKELLVLEASGNYELQDWSKW
jgi:hypothetical protein